MIPLPYPDSNRPLQLTYRSTNEPIADNNPRSQPVGNHSTSVPWSFASPKFRVVLVQSRVFKHGNLDAAHGGGMARIRHDTFAGMAGGCRCRPRIPDDSPALLRRGDRRPYGSPNVALDDAELSRSEEHTSELQSLVNLGCRLLLDKKHATTLAVR